MPRIRTVKPGFFKSEDVSTLPFRARLTWVGLWTQCDDHGRYKDSVRLLKGDIWSLDDVSLRDIEEDLTILEEQRRLVRYEVDGKRYLAVVNWHAHQAINRPGKPKYPAPPVALGSADPDDENHCDICSKPGTGTVVNSPSVTTHVALTEYSRQEGKGREGKGRDTRAGVSVDPPPPPTCPKHLDDPDPGPCGPCGDARKHRARWDAQQLAADQAARSAAAHQRAEATRLAIAACDLCTPDGRLTGGRLCTHDPHQPDRATRGAQQARAILAARKEGT